MRIEFKARTVYMGPMQCKIGIGSRSALVAAMRLALLPTSRLQRHLRPPGLYILGPIGTLLHTYSLPVRVPLGSAAPL